MADLEVADKPKRSRVCFVTTEFHGLFKNGGIGTANTGLALALAAAGFDVTVAYADSDRSGPRMKGGSFSDLQAKYRLSGITLDFVPWVPMVWYGFEDPRSASYCVYLYLKEQTFDVVYFNDCGGHGFYSLLAKRLGAYPSPPRMYVVAHGPHEWVLDLNSLRYWSRAPIITAHLERRCAELADALISPSQYLADWMVSHGWKMPSDVRVIQNIVPLPESVLPVGPAAAPGRVREIVFFGRMEVRKGIEMFCDAIDALHRATDLGQIDLSETAVVFMGKFSQIGGVHSGIYVLERARRWRSPLRLLTTYGQEDALAYLSRPGVLAVIPSLAENSPCVVAECLQLGVSFIATDSGGTPELVAPGDREACLCAPNAEALEKKLEQALKAGQGPGALAISQADTLAEWVRLTGLPPAEALPPVEGRRSRESAQPSTPDSAAARPLVSVCLTSDSLTKKARTFLHSLLSQDYPLMEILLPDTGFDGERLQATLSIIALAGLEHACRLLPEAPRDRSAQRNAAAAKAQGTHLLFVEEESVLFFSGCIDAMTTAAVRSGADIVTAVASSVDALSADRKEGRIQYLPIGSCLPLGALENCFGSGVLLVSRASFEQGPGFAPPCDADIEDWLFLASSALRGQSIEVLPQTPFIYRPRPFIGADRSRSIDQHRRLVEAYSAESAGLFKQVIESLVHRDYSWDAQSRGILENVDGHALELGLRVSSAHEPNSEEALQGFVQFCIERHRVQEAIDFALHNGRSLLTDAIGGTRQVAEALSLDAIGRAAVELWHQVAITDSVRERIGAVPTFPARSLTRPSEGVACYALDTGVTVLKAAAVCPPGTTQVQAVARVTMAGDLPVSVALAASSANARLQLCGQHIESEQPFWWSEWKPARISEDGCEVTLSIELPETFAGLLDLHFLTRTGDDGTRPEGEILWESVTATVAVGGAITASAVEPEDDASPVSRHLIEQGVLLTEAEDATFAVFVPGRETLLHPLPGRTVLARIGSAVPPGSRGIRSVVSLQRAEAHPVQFAVWARPTSSPVNDESEFTREDAFSGWFSVRDQFRRHSFVLPFAAPSTLPMDIYLATRVVDFPDTYFCHAVWHDLLILE